MNAGRRLIRFADRFLNRVFGLLALGAALTGKVRELQ